MDELLNGALENWGPLHKHVAHCERCCREWRRLRRLDHLAREGLRDPVPEADLEGLTAGVVRAIAACDPPTSSPSPAWTRRSLAAAVLVVVFLLGVAGGQLVWPRRLVTRQVIVKPYPVERVVKVAAPVVKERVIIRRVPVVRIRVVRVERPVTLAFGKAPDRAFTRPEPRPLDEPVEPTFVAGFAARPIITQELVPALLAAQDAGGLVPEVGSATPPVVDGPTERRRP
jgi:hypothetical protein